MTPDVGSDAGPRPLRGAPEEDAVLEQMDETGRGVGLVLGAQAETGDDVEEGQVALLVEEDAEAVVEDEVPAGIGCGRPEGQGQKHE